MTLHLSSWNGIGKKGRKKVIARGRKRGVMECWLWECFNRYATELMEAVITGMRATQNCASRHIVMEGGKLVGTHSF